LKVWTTPDFQNTSSTTNLEGEEIMDAPGKDGNASMPEQVNRPNPWRKKMVVMIFMKIYKYTVHAFKSTDFKRRYTRGGRCYNPIM
jgi:hypothetical protein